MEYPAYMPRVVLHAQDTPPTDRVQQDNAADVRPDPENPASGPDPSEGRDGIQPGSFAVHCQPDPGTEHQGLCGRRDMGGAAAAEARNGEEAAFCPCCLIGLLWEYVHIRRCFFGL